MEFAQFYYYFFKSMQIKSTNLLKIHQQLNASIALRFWLSYRTEKDTGSILDLLLVNLVGKKSFSSFGTELAALDHLAQLRMRTGFAKLLLNLL